MKNNHSKLLHDMAVQMATEADRAFGEKGYEQEYVAILDLFKVKLKQAYEIGRSSK